MDSSNQDFQRRFKIMLASLSPEKRNMLFETLRKMDPEARNKAMETILRRYETSVANRAGSAPVQGQGQSRPVTSGRETAAGRPGTEGRPGNEYRQPDVDRNDDIDESDFDNSDRSSAKKRHRVSVLIPMLLALILVLGIGALVLFLIDNKNDSDSESTDSVPTEVTIETDPAESTASPTPEPTSTPTPSPSPTPTPVPVAEDAPDLTGLTIVIDPGHQAETSSETESAASWLSVDKPRSTSGAVGVVTGIHEYELTLQYALVVRSYLEQCGATVILTRTENEVDISNQERAQIAVDNNADLFIRLYAGAANDSAQSGVKVYVPDSGNYTSSSTTWGNTLGSLVAEAEGMTFNNTLQTYLYTGLNYANTQRSFQLQLGFLSNSDDEAILVSDENAANVAAAIAVFCADFK